MTRLRAPQMVETFGRRLPTKRRHTARVVNDHRSTKRFCQDQTGLYLVSCGTEREVLFGVKRAWCHASSSLAEGGALVFFQFVEDRDHQDFGAKTGPSAFTNGAFKAVPVSQGAVMKPLETVHPGGATTAGARR